MGSGFLRARGGFMVRGQSMQDFERVIRETIFDHHDLQAGPSLGIQRARGVADERGPVVSPNNHGYRVELGRWR